MNKTNQITTKSAVLSILFFIGTVLNKTNVHYIATLLICLLALFLIWYEPRKTTWFESKKMPLWSKITSNVIAVSFFLSPLIFSDRQTILIYSALPLICAAAMVYCVFKTKNTEKEPLKPVEWWLIVFFLIFIEFAGNCRHFTFVNNAFLHCLPYAALFGILSGVCAVFVQYKPNKRASEHMGAFISATLILAIFFYFYAANLNYALDTAEPSEYMLAVTEKDKDRGTSRSPTTYDFTFIADGKEINVKIPKSHYDAYDIGDLYPVQKYSGAFGEPFYISKAYAEP
ncbi:MAG: hypothetical protein IJ428_03080 [Clostridia bacterium]|nr:hypothetical protein [Clostridia bacterium]